MSDANVVREWAVGECDPETMKVRTLGHAYSYGQAVNSATVHAERFPDRIIWVQSRVVIQEDWQLPDIEVEEYRLRQRLTDAEEES